MFLSSTVEPRALPEKKAKICQEMSQACAVVVEYPPSSSCDRCRAFVDNLAFDLRMQGPLRRAEGLKRQLWDTLEHICIKMHYRIPKPAKTQVSSNTGLTPHPHPFN